MADGVRKVKGPNDDRPLSPEEERLAELFDNNVNQPNNSNLQEQKQKPDDSNSQELKESKDRLQELNELRQHSQTLYNNMKAVTDSKEYEQQKDERHAAKKRMKEYAELINKLRGRIEKQKQNERIEGQKHRDRQRNPNRGRGYNLYTRGNVGR